ncbi:MAG: hypothetical protein QM775_07475 [Pirellulales bacterium]
MAEDDAADHGRAGRLGEVSFRIDHAILIAVVAEPFGQPGGDARLAGAFGAGDEQRIGEGIQANIFADLRDGMRRCGGDRRV